MKDNFNFNNNNNNNNNFKTFGRSTHAPFFNKLLTIDNFPFETAK